MPLNPKGHLDQVETVDVVDIEMEREIIKITTMEEKVVTVAIIEGLKIIMIILLTLAEDLVVEKVEVVELHQMIVGKISSKVVIGKVPSPLRMVRIMIIKRRRETVQAEMVEDGGKKVAVVVAAVAAAVAVVVVVVAVVVVAAAEVAGTEGEGEAEEETII